MVPPHVLEGTGEDLQRVLEQFPKDRFQLVRLPGSETEQEQEGNADESGSLYDLLRDYVGSVAGSGENNAARASDLFTDYVVKKHKAGQL